MKTLLCFTVLATGALAEMVDHEADLKALPTAPPGFEVKEFAREPLVRQPCSMAFDARGRLFVGMGPQYRNPKPDTPGDNVVIIEDTDGDGVADRTRAFATGLNAIQGLAWHGHDLWVANSPDLTIVRDLDGDDVADEYVRVYTDLGNIEHALHGLNWAPDGKLYMSKGNSKGLNLADRYAPKPFRELWGLPSPAGAQDFPPPQTFQAGEYRHAYHDPKDDWGQMGGVLRCDDLGRNLEIVARGLRNPWDIASDSGFNWLGTDNDQNEGDRIFMPFLGAHFGWGHAWSAHWTGEGHLPTAPISGPVFTGSGTGIVFYDAPQFPEQFRQVFFINDWLRKTMFVYRPRWDGALMQPEGGVWEPFVIGGKSLFRPTDLEVGPDGALWCLGWSTGYGSEWKDGEMINEGRIYRVSWQDAVLPRREFTPVTAKDVPELIADFNGPLPVWRIDAQEELVRRGAKTELVAALETGRLTELQETWAVWTLGRIAPQNEFLTRKAMEEKSSLNLRLQCVRMLAGGRTLPDFFATLLESPEPRLRFAAVQAIPHTRDSQWLAPLLALVAKENDRLAFYSAWQALRDCASVAAIKTMLLDSRAGVRRAALLALTDTNGITESEIQPLLGDADAQTSALAALWLARHRSNPLISFQPAEPDFEKKVTVKIKGALKPSELRYTLDGSLPALTSPWPKDGIVLDKTTTVRAGLFVSGMLVGTVAEMTYRKTDESLAPMVSLLSPPETPTTVEAVLALRGDAARGEQLFFALGGAGCANCHRVDTRGTNFGPDLTGLGTRADARHIVQSMLDPGAVITEGFNTNLIETRAGSWSGILLEESGVDLTLGLPDGKSQRIEKAKIVRRETLPTSAMPPFASLLQPQQCADVTAWLLAAPAEFAVVEKPDRLVITQGGTPEFDRIRANYNAALERVTAPITQSYLAELEKQRDAYARASKLDAANVVQAEISNIKQAMVAAQAARKLPPKAPTVSEAATAPQLHWFAGKTWLTDAKTRWTFARNGTGEKIRGKDRIATFTWKLLPSGNVELTERAAPEKPATATCVQFKTKSEAWFGTSEDQLTNRLHVE